MDMHSQEVSLLKVIRSYSPLLIGIAAAVLDLHATHPAHVDGLEVRKMETIVVSAQRLLPESKVVKLGTIVVTAKREPPLIFVSRTE